MTVVDTLVFGTVAIGLLLGMMRGFLSQITGLVAILGGGYLAWRYGPVLQAEVLDPRLSSQHNDKFAFAIILLSVVAVVATGGWGLRKLFETLEIGAYDRLMGAVLGACKAGIICAGVLLAIVALAHDGGEIERAISDSRAAPFLWKAMDQGARLLPGNVREDVQGFLNRNSLPAGAPLRQTLRPE